MAGGQVQLRSLTKRFDEHLAVDSIHALINAGEFFSLLGPSGCGKTTTLRMIAGFERPTSGEILLDGDDVANAAHERNVHTVFQNYALFPHLKVDENLAFRCSATGGQGRAPPAGRGVLAWSSSTASAAGAPGSSPAASSSGSPPPARSFSAWLLLLDEPLGALDASSASSSGGN